MMFAGGYVFGRVPRKPRPTRRRAVRPPPAPSGVTTTVDNSDAAAVLREIHNGVLPAVRAQFAALAPRDPGARGKLTLQMTVGPDGQALAVAATEDTLQSAELRRRVMMTVSRWRYPPSTRSVDVSFPFVFTAI